MRVYGIQLWTIVDKITYWHLHFEPVMATLTQHLRLLLIIAIVLSPVQPLFAMPNDDSTALLMDVMVTTAISDIAQDNVSHQNDVSQMLGEDCNKQGKCSNCLGASHCSSCPLSLGIPQITSKRIELGTQIQLIVPDVSIHSADLLPDYRPPRHF